MWKMKIQSCSQIDDGVGKESLIENTILLGLAIIATTKYTLATI